MSLNKKLVLTDRQTHKQSIVPSAHVGEGNYTTKYKENQSWN